MIVPKAGDVYEHHKGGLYVVISVAENSTNGRKGRVVVYMGIRGGPIGKLYAREEAEFCETVERTELQANGKYLVVPARPRFSLVKRP